MNTELQLLGQKIEEELLLPVTFFDDSFIASTPDGNMIVGEESAIFQNLQEETLVTLELQSLQTFRRLEISILTYLDECLYTVDKSLLPIVKAYLEATSEHQELEHFVWQPLYDEDYEQTIERITARGRTEGLHTALLTAIRAVNQVKESSYDEGATDVLEELRDVYDGIEDTDLGQQYLTSED